MRDNFCFDSHLCSETSVDGSSQSNNYTNGHFMVTLILLLSIADCDRWSPNLAKSGDGSKYSM